MQNLIQRVVTGAVFIAVLLAAMFINQWVFFAVFLLAMVGTQIEFNRLFKTNKSISFYDVIVVLAGIIIYSGFFLTHFASVSTLVWLTLGAPVVIYAVGFISKKQILHYNLWQSLAGLVYIIVPFIHMQALVYNNGDFNGLLLFYIFAFIWTNDSFAYLFGTQFGRHKMWPAVSPKKSWEGGIGGLLMVWLFCILLWNFAEHEYTLIKWLGFGLVVTVSATLGDFFESHLKRMAGVKDSGNILPGHGGFFDRFDSTLFAVPASVVYLHLVQII